jgi:hypothetical protein
MKPVMIGVRYLVVGAHDRVVKMKKKKTNDRIKIVYPAGICVDLILAQAPKVRYNDSKLASMAM